MHNKNRCETLSLKTILTAIIIVGLTPGSALGLITTTGAYFPFYQIGPGDADLGTDDLAVGNFSIGSLIATDATLSVSDLQVARGGSTGELILNNSTLNVTNADGNDGISLEIGNWGHGVMRVLSGSIVNATFAGSDCNSFGACMTLITDAAGSSGHLEISGVGSRFEASEFLMGWASVFTTALDGFDFGTPGATSFASLLINDSGSLNAETVTLGGLVACCNGSSTGGERAVSSAGVTGNGTIQTGTLTLGVAHQTQATLTISAGGAVTVDTTNDVGDAHITIDSGGVMTQNQLRIAVAELDHVGSATVKGAGSELNFTGDDSFVSVGGAGSGHLEIRDGAKLNDALHLTAGFFDEGGASVVVDGVGTEVNLTGVCVDCANLSAAPGSGASLIVGLGGIAAMNISGRAKVNIDGTGATSRHGLLVGAVGPGLNGGFGFGNGTLVIEGGGTEVNLSGPQAAVDIGVFGGSGNVVVADGAKVLLPAGTGETNVGGNNGNGALTVSGAGSLFDAGASFVGGNQDNTIGGLAFILIELGGELRADTITLNQGFDSNRNWRDVNWQCNNQWHFAAGKLPWGTHRRR
ncbi:MAG: T5SS/PEP-CTERM-associated repeat protein [Gammaproteobacteria bacterium]|jgi:T5SS/PEP-CTERM-associated repeat protein